jgi:hypothetical protein
MDALPLPPRPNLNQYKKRAKELVAAAHAGHGEAIDAWAERWLTALTRSLGLTKSPGYEALLKRAIGVLVDRTNKTIAAAPGRLGLADAQHLIAGVHGFENWAAFGRHLEAPFKRDSRGREFEAAVDAVVSGDLETLRGLVGARPQIVHEHSTRAHHATLLHYVAANGVENYRQRTPPNAVEVARCLLDAGARVDGLADTYGHDHWQTTMNLLVSSAHPAGAGLMTALVEVLLDYGAAVNGLQDDESPLLTALDFGYIDAAETLVRRGARLDNVPSAAALGRLDLVRAFVVDANTLAAGVPLVAPAWVKVGKDRRPLERTPTAHLAFALAWACKFQRREVASFLLDAGVSPTAKDGYNMTALHWAAANGLMDLISRLLSLGAPLEVENIWGGTVLDSTAYFAESQPVTGVDYPAVLEMLATAGAELRVLDGYPVESRVVAEFLRRRRRTIGGG